MATHGQFNTKNPTIKRILKEASELASNPSVDLHAEPLEDNLFEWHFTVRGPPAPSPYAGGIYHGRIVLPPAYPLRPPSFRFLTPTGRFEVNREICLSISGHHEETWQPAWGIRTAMVAIRSFMDTGAKGQVGGLECDDGARRRMASESVGWRCGTCGKANNDIMKERESAAKELEESQEGSEQSQKKEDVVPDELRLAYRDELGSNKPVSSPTVQEPQSATSARSPVSPSAQSPSTGSNPVHRLAASPTSPLSQTPTSPNRSTPIRRTVQQTTTNGDIPYWLDRAIFGVICALIFMVVRKLF